ncbi:MAG TPA: hypothetical protein VGH72_33555 [Pseudonocardia sp.]|jgi:hypothetical protein
MADDHTPGPSPDNPRGYKLSRNTLKDKDGNCTHPDKPGSRFCHSKGGKAKGLCHRPAGWGTDHAGYGPCKLHFGNSPNVRKRAAELELTARATRELEQVNSAATPVDNPLEELARLAGEALRWKDIMAAHVAHLTNLRYSTFDDEGRHEQIRGEVVLYERAMNDAARLLVAIGRLNIDERLVRIEEQKAAIVVKAVEAALRAAGVPPDKMESARAAAGAEIRKLAAA